MERQKRKNLGKERKLKKRKRGEKGRKIMKGGGRIGRSERWRWVEREKEVVNR